MRLRVYATLSMLACVAVVAHAFREKGQFYPAMIHLQASKLSFVVVCNMGLMLGIALGRLITAVFLGSLRLIEIEHLYDRSWYAVTETCLAMTIFREEFNSRFMLLFGVLLLLKILHWLAQDRVDFIEQSPNVRLLTHARLLGLLALLTSVDAAFYFYALSSTVKKGPSVLLLFAFEAMILQSTLLFVYAKYAFHAVDKALHGRWEGKGECLFYLELLTDLLQLILYLAFFLLIFSYYGLPLHIVRELYVTFRNFRQRLSDFIRYRRVMSQLGSLAPVTEEDLAYDATCIICREEVPLHGAKKLRCGHLFHSHCLRSWLQRQQTCPTCRSAVFPHEQPAQQPQPPNAAAAPQEQRLPAAGAAQPHDDAQRAAAALARGAGAMPFFRAAEQQQQQHGAHAAAQPNGGAATTAAAQQQQQQQQQLGGGLAGMPWAGALPAGMRWAFPRGAAEPQEAGATAAAAAGAGPGADGSGWRFGVQGPAQQQAPAGPAAAGGFQWLGGAAGQPAGAGGYGYAPFGGGGPPLPFGMPLGAMGALGGTPMGGLPLPLPSCALGMGPMLPMGWPQPPPFAQQLQPGMPPPFGTPLPFPIPPPHTAGTAAQQQPGGVGAAQFPFLMPWAQQPQPYPQPQPQPAGGATEGEVADGIAQLMAAASASALRVAELERQVAALLAAQQPHTQAATPPRAAATAASVGSDGAGSCIAGAASSPATGSSTQPAAASSAAASSAEGSAQAAPSHAQAASSGVHVAPSGGVTLPAAAAAEESYPVSPDRSMPAFANVSGGSGSSAAREGGDGEVVVAGDAASGATPEELRRRRTNYFASRSGE